MESAELVPTPALTYVIDKINKLNLELDDCDERSYKFEYTMIELEHLEEIKDLIINDIYRSTHPEFDKELFGKEEHY